MTRAIASNSSPKMDKRAGRLEEECSISFLKLVASFLFVYFKGEEEKMKTKLIVALIMPVLLVSMLIYTFPACAATGDPINIGIVADQGMIMGQQIWFSAEIARDEINAKGGIDVDGMKRPVELTWIDEHLYPARPDLAKVEFEAALPNLDFVYGAVYAASGLLMTSMKDYAAEFGKPVWIGTSNIDSAHVVDCQDGGPAPLCGDCCRCDYQRAKYIFRLAPPNSATIIQAIVAYYRYELIPHLAKIYGTPVRVYIASSSSSDGQLVARLFCGNGTGTELAPDPTQCYVPPDMPGFPKEYWGFSPPSPYSFLGDQCIVVGGSSYDVAETDFKAVLDDVDAKKAQVMYMDFDDVNGATFMQQWATRQCKALPCGINVAAMLDEFSYMTGGAGIGESHPDFSATKVAFTPQTLPFTQKYVQVAGSSPIYIAFSTYDSINMLAEAFESDAYKQYSTTPGVIDYNVLIPVLEMTDRTGVICKERFAGPDDATMNTYMGQKLEGIDGPYLNYTTYPYLNINPTMKGTLHDAYIEDYGPTWTNGYFRLLMCQWQNTTAGPARVVVYPRDQAYSRKSWIPSWVYSHADSDTNLDGKVDILDIFYIAKVFGRKPYQLADLPLEADVNSDGKVDIIDIFKIAQNFGYKATTEYGSWPIKF